MTENAAQQIHDASIALLADPGIRIEHDEIVALLLANGAQAGNDANVVRIDRRMIAEAIERCPRTVTLADRRSGAPAGSPNDATFWSCPGMSLYHRGEHRPFTTDDMAAAARLLDRLDNVGVVFGLAMHDVPPAARDVVGLQIMAANCTKHIRVLCFSPAGARALLEMKGVVSDQPWFSVGFTAHGPLRWTNLALEIYRCTAGAGIPATINGEPMAGVSGPVTLAGSAAVGNAEILAGIVINQLLEPGRPCIYNLGLAHTFDMKTAVAVTGAPENVLLADLSGVMGRFYKLPSCSWVSTEAMSADAQAGLEKMFAFSNHWASGVDHIWGVGQLESEISFSPAQAVIDNEMIEYIRRFRRGVDVNAETLALDVTREVGIAGSFLESDHTLDNFRSELFMPEVLFRQKRAAWDAASRPTLENTATDRADELMAAPAETNLDDHQLKTLADIADRAVKAC